MAKSFFLLLLSLFIIIILLAVTESEAYSKTMPFKELKPTKLTHLHFYFHDTISGTKPSSVQVAEASTTNSSATLFGTVMVADDPLTEGPNLNSKEVGRAQGMFALSGMYSFSFTMVFNFVFTEGAFNGSSVALYGRNPIMSSKVREMPIIGGTGAFRLARGYAQCKTYKIVGKDGVFEYNFYIWH